MNLDERIFLRIQAERLARRLQIAESSDRLEYFGGAQEQFCARPIARRGRPAHLEKGEPMLPSHLEPVGAGGCLFPHFPRFRPTSRQVRQPAAHQQRLRPADGRGAGRASRMADRRSKRRAVLVRRGCRTTRRVEENIHDSGHAVDIACPNGPGLCQNAEALAGRARSLRPFFEAMVGRCGDAQAEQTVSPDQVGGCGLADAVGVLDRDVAAKDPNQGGGGQMPCLALASGFERRRCAEIGEKRPGAREFPTQNRRKQLDGERRMSAGGIAELAKKLKRPVGAAFRQFPFPGSITQDSGQKVGARAAAEFRSEFSASPRACLR